MVDTISTSELESKIENSENFVLVDVLGKDHFEDGHIPGAVNIPLENIASEMLDRFEKDEEIVVYCASESCSASPKAAEKLDSLGFENVKDYEPGVKGWEEAGNELKS